MSKARDIADVGAVVGRKNLIINGGMQVSQRGDYTTSTTFSNGTYYHDRWVGITGVSANLQELSTNQPNSQSGKSARVTTTSSGTAQCALEQRFESPQWLKSRTVKLSAWVKSNSSNCALNFYHGVSGFGTPVSHTGGGAWEKLEMEYTLSGTETSDFRARIGLSQGGNTSITSGDYFEITEVQLELGSVATDFEHRSYGEELALCQRYYEKGHIYSIAARITPIYENRRSSDIFFKVSKRVTPTVTASVGFDGSGSLTSLYAYKDMMRVYSSNTSSYMAVSGFTADAEL